MSKPDPKAPQTPAQRHEQIRTEGARETVESIVVAIILALLFRAFVAEAFVIPTGSMAPTLMGAHKDVVCLECGQPYQTGASIETKSMPHEIAVVASICANCRHLNPVDLSARPNDATFAGDRILVSKFAYALADPERWDVIVFKYPGNPKQNYIKRLVGLPNETLRIRYGDVYARPHGEDDFVILRKPPAKVLAMAHQVHDTLHQPTSLVEAGYPARWQPWHPSATEPPSDSWQVLREDGAWVATLDGAESSMRTMRYYHHWATEDQWDRVDAGMSLASVDPYTSRAITDFYAYNSYVTVDTDEIYDVPPGMRPKDLSLLGRLYYNFSSPGGVLRSDYQPGIGEGRDRYGISDSPRDGQHWVGDLLVDVDIETQGTEGEVMLELVEAAVLYRCYIDLGTGRARLEIVTESGPISFTQAGGVATKNPTAETDVRAGGRHLVRFANCDDQLYLWVDDSPVVFDAPTTFNTLAIRPVDQQRPHTSAAHPYDAAPVAIGVQGAEATVHRIQVMRDQYYIAVDSSTRAGGLDDYDYRQRDEDIQRVLSDPETWDSDDLWQSRRVVDFVLDEDQFFPMGDNSPESADARCWISGHIDPYGYGFAPADAYIWANASYVPRDLLVGKALIVFWPHTWNSPIPFTPNLRRMGFIR